MTIVWASILGSAFMFVGLGVFLPSPAGFQPPAPLAAVLGVVALAIAAISFVLPARASMEIMASHRDRVVEEVATGDGATYRGENQRRRVLRLDRSSVDALLQRAQAPFILSLALSESIVLFGLVLCRLGAPLATAAPTAAGRSN